MDVIDAYNEEATKAAGRTIDVVAEITKLAAGLKRGAVDVNVDKTARPFIQELREQPVLSEATVVQKSLFGKSNFFCRKYAVGITGDARWLLRNAAADATLYANCLLAAINQVTQSKQKKIKIKNK